jgi:hypothetical protein
MQVSPESDASEGGSQDAHSHEEADQRHARERDLMRELDRITGRAADANEGAPDTGPQPETGADSHRAEEVDE